MASNSGISYATANIWKIGSSPLHKSVTDQEEPSSSPGAQPHVGAGSRSLSWTEPGRASSGLAMGIQSALMVEIRILKEKKKKLFHFFLF